MHTPLVSVICLCYNQKPFVAAAIRSARAQTYQNTELIVVDDGSQDGSQEEIKKTLEGTTDIKFVDLQKNMGNCAAFNKGFAVSRGEYIIDLAADDLLLPKRIEEGINDFANAPENIGVHFSDAFIINEQGDTLRTHYRRNAEGQLDEDIPSGDVYLPLISRYFISPPTMMFKRSVLEKLNGYDESLHYEDFDFWIRSSRDFQYFFNKAPLVKRRIVRKSHATAQFAFRSKHLATTYAVCEKIFDLNQNSQEDKALIQRCNYEIRQCVKIFNFGLIPKYNHLKRKTYRRLSSSSSIER